MKKIFTVARVKNENDIIESFCRYNLIYCDGMLIRDNGSFDNTKEIIQNLIGEGLPIYWTNKGNKLKMAQEAIDKYGADLVVPLDADEFLYHTGGINPRETLEALREDIEYRIPWRTYIYEKEPDIELGFMPNNFTHYRNPVLEHLPKALASKYLIKEKQVCFTMGAHSFAYPEEHKDHILIESPPNLVYAHFPLRSNSQIMKKIIPNWINKWATPFPFSAKHSFQLNLIYNAIKEKGEISEDFLVRHSIEYSVDEEHMKKTMSVIKNAITIYNPMDISFCSNQLVLHYTNYNWDNRVFLRTTLSEINKAVIRLSCENNDIERQRDELMQNYLELKRQHNELIQDYHVLTQQNNILAEQIGEIYASKIWKAGNYIKEFIRLFFP